ncbi:MAG TPA: MBL fold metallo-hydrolase [Acidothermaceae bacterium]|jgi:glyoxylase-like metal-dependent hydrolase (beta-lactamase superfamily II)|nr:MBL fold metallo-hydrolase [Acidothermaceae bacterium]
MPSDDAYTGDVQVGGPVAVRELPGLRITKVAVGPYDNNAYLLRCTATGDTMLIDAAAEPDRLLTERGNGLLVSVVTTHQHPDHWQGLEAVVGITGPAVIAHPLDAPRLPIPMTQTVVDGDVLDVGNVQVKVIHLKGHTPGSIAIVYDWDSSTPHIFTGDSLFPGGPGNTRKNVADFTSLMNDLETRVFGVLPDATWVYPGHGADTTLGVERPHLAEWRARGW